MSKDVEIPASLKEYFVKFNIDIKEEEFLALVDQLAQGAFDASANPRIPLISDIKEIYLDAYYGKPVKLLKK